MFLTFCGGSRAKLRFTICLLLLLGKFVLNVGNGSSFAGDSELTTRKLNISPDEDILLEEDVEELGAPVDRPSISFSEEKKSKISSYAEGTPSKKKIPPPHKELFPLDSSDYYGLFFAAVGLMIAAGGGIGGGGILVPIFILVLGFKPKYAIPLSNITILGGGFTNMILNIPKRHPNADRPLVDWDLIMIMEPLTIAGAIAGSFLNKLLPDWLLAASLILLLGFTSKKTIEKGIKTYKKETMDMIKESELSVLSKTEKNEEEQEQTVGLLEDGDRGRDEDTGIDTELQKLYEEESKTPWNNIYQLTGMFVVIIAANLLKGGGAFKSPLGITCGTWSFWALTAFIFLWILAVSWIVRKQLLKKYECKKRLGYAYVEGDVEWDEKATLRYPLICFFAGFCAGLFGVGGGIVKGPLMLEMGVHPLVASATSAVMICYTSFSAATSFVVFGLLRYDYAIPLFFVGIICTAIGQIGVNYLIKKSKRSSYIIMSIGSVVALSTVMMGAQSILAFINGTSGSGGGICSSGGASGH